MALWEYLIYMMNKHGKAGRDICNALLFYEAVRAEVFEHSFDLEMTSIAIVSVHNVPLMDRVRSLVHNVANSEDVGKSIQDMEK